MKQGFEFSSDKTAYSVDGLRRLCEQEPTKALTHLKSGYIEQWLDYMGEIELANIAYEIVKDTKYVQEIHKIKTLIDVFEKPIYLQNKLNIQYINKSIDIILQEYETLRTEILNIFQNRTQLIILGLAAIFTLVGLGLAPLTDFLTTDQITLNHPISITVKETKKIRK